MTNEKPALLVAYRAGSEALSKSVSFLITVAAARRLTGEAFGVFSLGTTLGWLAAVGTDFGIQLHVARAVSRHPEAAPHILREWLRIRLGMGAVAVGGIAVLLWTTRIAGPFTGALFLLTVSYIVNALVEFLFYFYRGLSRSDLESSLTLGLRGATGALVLIALWWRPSLGPLALAMVLPAVATFAYGARRATLLGGAAAARADVRPPAAPTLADPAAARDHEATTWWSDVAPIGLGIVLSAMYFRVDVFLVAWWQGPAAAGLYNAVFRVIDALRLFPAAALAVLLPSLCRATDARPLVRLSMAMTAFGIATMGALWASAPWAIPILYGGAYASAIPAFRVLTLSLPLMSLNYSLTHQLIAWDRHRLYALVCATALVTNVVANARLIPSWSVVGAAWATVLTEAVVTAGCTAGLLSLGLRRRTTVALAATEGV